MSKEIKLPKLSEDANEGQVTEVMVKEGDTISEEDSIIAVASDKATVEVPSPEAGVVEEVKVKEGDKIKTGDVILLLEEKDSDEDEDRAEKEQEKQKEEHKSDEDTKQTKEETEAEEREEKKEDGQKEKVEQLSGKDKIEKESKEVEQEHEELPAAPGARRLAREQGVDLNEIKGSGPEGLITEDDVRKYAGMAEPESQSGTQIPDFSKWGEVERRPLSETRKAVAKQTTQSWQAIPHVTQFDEADVGDIQNYIDEHQSKAKEKGGKLTITTVLIKLIAGALHQFPKFNASIDMANREVIFKKYVHISVAVDTENGLLMPVIKNVNRKSIIDIAAEVTEVAEKARNQELSAGDMDGGNFAISNLGGIGGTQFTPVIYHPNVAILGASEITVKPVFTEGNFQPRPRLPLNLSYDHRLIDGAEGARFLRFICNALEDPYKALLGE